MESLKLEKMLDKFLSQPRYLEAEDLTRSEKLLIKDVVKDLYGFMKENYTLIELERTPEF